MAMENSQLLRDYLVANTEGFQVQINKLIVTTKTHTEIIGTYNHSDYHGRYQEDVPFTITLMDLLAFAYDTVKNEVDAFKPDQKY